eukprot:6180793-Pleurochrysis_carterae.AAC.5
MDIVGLIPIHPRSYTSGMTCAEGRHPTTTASSEGTVDGFVELSMVVYFTERTTFSFSIIKHACDKLRNSNTVNGKC